MCYTTIIELSTKTALFYCAKGVDDMTIVKCARHDCIHRGTDVCTAQRIDISQSFECSSYEPVSNLMRPGHNPHCVKQGGKYKSSSKTVIR